MRATEVETTTVMTTAPGTISSFVADQLRRQILEGILEPGERLRSDEVAESFEVSKIPVREALRQLEAEGLVTIYPRRGAIVSRLSLDQLQDITEIRLLLEQTAIRSAIPNMTSEDLDSLRDLLKQMETEEKDLAAWLELNRQFHVMLYKPSRREFLLQLIDSLRAQCDRYLRLNATMSSLINVSRKEHQGLLEACVDQNIERAEKIIAAHISRSTAELIEYLGTVPGENRLSLVGEQGG
jgi:DNA-binding GntR family transcriptional regulator